MLCRIPIPKIFTYQLAITMNGYAKFPSFDTTVTVTMAGSYNNKPNMVYLLACAHLLLLLLFSFSLLKWTRRCLCFLFRFLFFAHLVVSVLCVCFMFLWWLRKSSRSRSSFTLCIEYEQISAVKASLIL